MKWRLGRDVIGPDESTIYMRRWFFQCPLFGVRIHHILRSDVDKHLHDHPWDFVSLLLTGGYTEVVPEPGTPGYVRRISWPMWSFIRHKAEDLHRLILDRPVWTLVFTGPRRRSWGFMTEQGWIAWRYYLAGKGTHVKSEFLGGSDYQAMIYTHATGVASWHLYYVSERIASGFACSVDEAEIDAQAAYDAECA